MLVDQRIISNEGKKGLDSYYIDQNVFKGAFDMLVDQRIISNGGKKGLDSYYIDQKELNSFCVQNDDQPSGTHDSKLGGDIASDLNLNPFLQISS